VYSVHNYSLTYTYIIPQTNINLTHTLTSSSGPIMHAAAAVDLIRVVPPRGRGRGDGEAQLGGSAQPNSPVSGLWAPLQVEGWLHI